jgi:hypothetical protein
MSLSEILPGPGNIPVHEKGRIFTLFPAKLNTLQTNGTVRHLARLSYLVADGVVHVEVVAYIN